MSDLANKNIIITGAGSGIGRASCLLAAQQGAHVIAVDVNDSVERTIAEIESEGGEAFARQLDIRDEASVLNVFSECESRWGSVDGLYANAGVVGSRDPYEEMSAEDFANTLSVNTVGTFICVRAATRYMLPRSSGSIVMTASVAGLRANAGGVDYSASKAAVISMAQTMAYKLYGTGIRINAICPGLIETGMTEPFFTATRARGKEKRIGQVNPSKRYGHPPEIAEMACFLLSDAASYVNGQAIAVDGGLSASHPWSFPR